MKDNIPRGYEHWRPPRVDCHIENSLPWVRDVIYDEDRSQV